jgi:hypothetical protein
MEELRIQQFKDRVVAALREGKAKGVPPELVARQLVENQMALAAAVVSPEVVTKASELYLAAKGGAIQAAQFAPTPDDAQTTMGQILLRRASDARQYAGMLGNETFCAEVLAAAENPNSPPFAKATLEDVKFVESVDELLHKNADGKSQVLAHVDAFRDGTVITHHALAQTFHPHGELHKVLSAALAQSLPGEENKPRVHAMTMEWLGDRFAAAQVTVQQILNDGPAYKAAVERSKADNPTPAMAPAVAPAARGFAPRESYTQLASDTKGTGLLMDRI